MHQITLPHSPKLFNSIPHNDINILLFLLDYDGCIARSICYSKIRDTKILQHIESRIKKITPEFVLIANGSNRQTVCIDQKNENRNNNGSCFANLPKLTEYLHEKISSPTIKLLKLTVSDVINRLHTGDVMTGKKVDKFAIDEKKILLLLTQVHYAAQKFKHKKIQINFYDDIEKTLVHLSQLFKKLNRLIPENVIIKFFYYTEKSPAISPKEKGSIQGIGKPIKEWKNLIISSASYRREIDNEIEQEKQEKFLTNYNYNEKLSKDINDSIENVKDHKFKFEMLAKLKGKIKKNFLSFTPLTANDISFSNKNKKVYIKINENASIKMTIDGALKSYFNFDAMGLTKKYIKNKKVFICKDNAYLFINRPVDFLKDNIKDKILYFYNDENESLELKDISFLDKTQ